jgi:hypothetical protein
MSILGRKSFGRLARLKADDASLMRAARTPCPRCGTVNCTNHSASMLTSRLITTPHRQAHDPGKSVCMFRWSLIHVE